MSIQSQALGMALTGIAPSEVAGAKSFVDRMDADESGSLHKQAAVVAASLFYAAGKEGSASSNLFHSIIAEPWKPGYQAFTDAASDVIARELEKEASGLSPVDMELGKIMSEKDDDRPMLRKLLTLGIMKSTDADKAQAEANAAETAQKEASQILNKIPGAMALGGGGLKNLILAALSTGAVGGTLYNMVDRSTSQDDIKSEELKARKARYTDLTNEIERELQDRGISPEQAVQNVTSTYN